MNTMKKLLLLVLALTMVLCLCACGESGNGQDETTTASTEESTTLGVNGGFAERPSEEETTIPEGYAVYSVKVVDQDGNPVAGAVVQICKDTCLPTVTDVEGKAVWTMPEDDYKVSFTKMPSGYAYVDENITEWYFEDGSYEMTIVLQVALEDSSK